MTTSMAGPGRASGRLHTVPREAAPPATLASALIGGEHTQASDALATFGWGLRRYAWVFLGVFLTVGILLPLRQVNQPTLYTSESLVVAATVGTDLKVLPRYGAAVFDNGQVAAAVAKRFGDGGDLEDVVPRRVSLVTEQDSLVFHVQGHARDPQTSADIANAAALVFVDELNAAGEGVGTFIVQSTAVPPVERDEPLSAAPTSLTVGLFAGAVAGLGAVLLLLVIRRPVVDAAAAVRATDLPMFGMVTLPRGEPGEQVDLADVHGLAPLCRSLLDAAPEAVLLFGPDSAAVRRRQLGSALEQAFSHVARVTPGSADGDRGTADEARDAGTGIRLIDASSSIDLVAPGVRSFVLLVAPVGSSMSLLRGFAGELRGVPAAVVLVRSRGRRRRRAAVAAPGRVKEPAGEPHPDPGRPALPRLPLPRPNVPGGLGRATSPSSTGGPAVPDSRADEVLAWVAGEAAEWFPDTAAGGASLRLLRVLERPRCRIYDVAVHGSTDMVERVIVKERALDSARRRADRFAGRRPTLSPALVDGDAAAAEAEFRGLSAVYVSLGKRPSFELAPLRPLDTNSDLAAIAMAHLEAQSLKDLSAAAWGKGTYGDDLAVAASWARAGAWLKRYHHVVPVEGLPEVRTTSAEIVELLQQFADFLSAEVGHGKLLHRFADVASEAAASSLGAQFLTVPAHGDFVAQNVLVTSAGAVAVIDPLPQWQVSRLEDLARMIVGARLFEPSSHRPDYRSAMPAARRSEVALLSSYFLGEAVPVTPLRVFVALCTLDRWADLVAKRPAGLVRGQLRDARVAAMTHTFVREVRDQLTVLRPSGRTHTSWI